MAIKYVFQLLHFFFFDLNVFQLLLIAKDTKPFIFVARFTFLAGVWPHQDKIKVYFILVKNQNRRSFYWVQYKIKDFTLCLFFS
jgi:hypothetical protein